MRRKKIFRWWLLPLIAVLIFLLTLFAGNHREMVEACYSRGLYPYLACVLSVISSVFPFSLDDLLYGLLILAIPVLIVLLIMRKLSLKRFGKIVLNVLAAMYILFYVLWGFNYYRSDLNSRLGIKNAAPDSNEFVAVLQELIDKTNKSYCSLDALNRNETDRLVEESYKNLAPVLKLRYPAGIRNDKSITLSKLFAQSGITGYFGPFFNEVHVNKKVLPVEYPAVLAHEKAHQFGITGESEANFYAWLVCSESKSKELNYSGNLFVLRYFFYQARSLETYPDLVKMISPGVQKDFDRIREHWDKLRKENYEKVASKVNDAYLKTNAIETGIDDYYGVVKHVMDFSLDSSFNKQIIPFPKNYEQK